MLTTIVCRTLTDEIRWHTRDKRSPRVERPSDTGRPEHLADPRTSAGDTDSAARGISEWLEEMRAAVRDVHEKAIDILDLSLEGLQNNDCGGP